MYRGKRALDLLLVFGTAPLWAPLLLVLALLVRFVIGAPVFFRQRRIGHRERPFQLIKFRTMTEARTATGELLPDAERLTAFGQWLRSSSLDELPELWNVVRGDMSLVGPRPLLEEYLPRYLPRHRRRHLAFPGITGLAQVSGRNSLTWAERFELDVEYVKRASLLLDITILRRTATAVLMRRGISAPGQATMPVFLGYGEAADPADAGGAASDRRP